MSRNTLSRLACIPVLALASSAALAQTSPFATGATAFQTNLLAILTPIAVVAVMALNFLGDGLRDAADPYNT